MKHLNPKYITGILAVFLPALGGCTDDLLFDEPELALSSDYVSFSAEVSSAREPRTRSEKELYSPLELNNEENELPLYLHTYEHALGDDYVDESPSTRGLQVNSAQGLYDIHKSFGVRAMTADTGREYIPMQDARLISTDDHRVWTTKSPVRWPGNERLLFNAIAPCDDVTEFPELSFGECSIDFTYSALKGDGSDDAEKQHDLMMAVAGMTKEATASYNHRVPLKFHHALSAVKFAVRDVLKGKVVSISIQGINGTGDCSYTAEDNSENGIFDWSGQRDVSTYTQVFNHEIENGNFNPGDEGQDVLLNNKMPEKTFMLIPQQIPDDALIEIVIERENVVAGLQKTITVRGKIKANNVTEWKAGYEYVYTISTSKDNWVNIFEVTGNHLSSTGAHNVDGDQIYVYSPSKTEWDTYENKAYFNVKSYRYKANDHTFIEALPWRAEHGGSLSYNVDNNAEIPYPAANPQKKYLSASQWLTDTFTTPLQGEGSATKNARERHDIRLFAHYVSTDWKGDETMQGYSPYPGFTKDNPYDLSTFGGSENRNTANCYVIDRGGWYMFPLVYGNAIRDGRTYDKAYKSQNTSGDEGLKLLKNMKDYNGKNITQATIMDVTSYAKAALIWQDAYDLVEQIELVQINGEKMIRFHVDPNSLQQGNAIIALKDGNGVIMWSWHIWATEHWLDPVTRKPHVFDKGNGRFNTFTPNYKTGMRECGDVEVTYNQKNRSFMMAPYNVGWCDPKKVLYLKRKSDMKFTQYMPGSTKETGNTATLPIIQAGDVIDYKFANNTYYQWGRKDPMRGYFNHEHDTKRTFGPNDTQPKFAYQEDISSVTIERSIRYPFEFYVSREGDSKSPYQDWLRGDYYSNLWNNDADISIATTDKNDNISNLWSHVKTIYDPCPAGYMVPNAGVWHVIQKKWSDAYTDDAGKIYTDKYYYDGKYFGDEEHTIEVNQRDKWAGGNWSENMFSEKVNGQLVDQYTYKVWGKGNANVDSEALFFSSTGNRWWSDGWKPNGIGAGGNFGRNVSYAWSNRTYAGYNSYGMALGLDTDREILGENAELRYYVGGQFIGRRAMGRPVRAIREP